MGDLQRQGQHPLWVRFAARERTIRRTALAQVTTFSLLAAIGFLIAAFESGSTSFLGALAVPFGLTAAGLCAGAALWSWLAVRWVDRHGTWEQPPT
jgi:hypothetical protein